MVTRCRGAGWCAAVVFLLCTACDPQLTKDEDVERALERGRVYRSRHLYAKAEETFLGALQRHPKNARIHKELGYLYFEDLTDYVSALYHLERYLQAPPSSQPNDLRSDVLEQVRAICQQEIAKEVSLSVLTTALRKEIESLGESNKTLRVQVANLSQRLQEAQARPPARRGDSAPGDTETVPSGDGNGSRTPATQPQVVSPPPTRPLERLQPGPATVASSRPRTHTIRKGETLFSLSRRYHVSVPQLERANPRVQHDNLQIGQQIVIPEP